MKANRGSILIFGHDEYLLLTRQWVLQSRGYRVLTTSTVTAINSLPLTPAIQLVLLCHSLEPAEVAEVMADARARWPGITCFELKADDGRAPAGILGQLLHTMEGPEKLVSLVDRLVGSNTPHASQTQH